MPGVPPDALNQVKKGLKGLFSRKRRDKTHTPQQPTDSTTTPAASSSSHAGATAGTATGAATAAGTATEAQPPSTTTSSPMPQLSTPANIAESQNIDLNPSGPSTDQHHHQPSAEKTTPAPLTVKPPAEGMSATSGPLSDDLGGGYNTAMSSPTAHAHPSHTETSAATKGITGAGAGEAEAAKIDEGAQAVEEKGEGGKKPVSDATAS